MTIVVYRTDSDGQPIDPEKAPAELKQIATYLKAKDSKLRTKEASFNGVRAEYFKGKRAVDALFKAAEQKKLPVKTREEPHDAMKRLMESHNFFFRVEKQEKRTLALDSVQTDALQQVCCHAEATATRNHTSCSSASHT